ncbi:MAG: transporter ATP-binding protein [Burkholderiales bacterium]|jgi:ABC-2 type transport system ATP-binding protein|nr:transporter ATP-binding protein [Burkholderiales bacterium]
MNALEISNVSKSYGTHIALNSVSFNVEQGDFVGLLGVNGAGKTTLISSIAGINKFNGRIKVMGHDVISDVVRAKRNLGVVPQELAYDPFLTVYQTLKFQSGLYGVSNNHDWLDEVIDGMHLKDKINTKTRGLSGGMKRRLMVAQALVHKPPVIILDEPTAGVDVEIRKSLWGFIKKLNNAGHTILLTTHYLEEVEQVCNKIVMIDKGNILAKSSTNDLMNHTHNLPTTVKIETKNGSFSTSLQDKVLNQDGNVFTLRLNNSDELLLILNTLKESGVSFGDIAINRPSLEDIFINFIRRDSTSGV